MKMPKSWGDINIAQFVSITKKLSETPDSIDLKVKLLSELTQFPESYFYDLNYKDFNKMCGELSFLNDVKFSEKLIYSFKIDGIKFEVLHDISKLTAAEYVDLCNFMSDKDKINDNLHKILAIFCKPKAKWFGLVKVNMRRGEVAKLLLNKMPITIAYPLSVFFCEVLASSIAVTKDYLGVQMKKALKEAKRNGLLKNGDGIQP